MSQKVKSGASKNHQIPKDSPRPPRVVCTVENDEKNKYNLSEEEEKKSLPSVSDSSSDSASEYDIHQASLPKIKISHYDEALEKMKRGR